MIHIDSDDSCKPELLEKLYDVIEQTKADLVVYSFDLIDLQGNTIKTNSPVFGEGEIIEFEANKEDFIRETLKNHSLNGIWIKCAKREIIDIDIDYSSYGRLMMGEDILQSAALYENATKIAYFGLALYLYRVNPNGMSRTIKKEYLYHFLTVRMRIYEMIVKLNLSEETKKVFYKYYIHYYTNYMLKLPQICQKEEYYELGMESIKKFIPVDLRKLKNSSSIIDRVAFSICRGKNYWLIKLISILYFR